jgi:hypothetical protein
MPGSSPDERTQPKASSILDGAASPYNTSNEKKDMKKHEDQDGTSTIEG